MAHRDVGRTQPAVMLLALAALAAAAWTAPLRADERISDDPRIQAAIERGLRHLRQSGASGGMRSESLVALALLKSGDAVDSPRVESGIESVRRQVKEGVYQPASHHYYTAGLDMMLLEAADPETYRTELEAIAKHIIAGQLQNGSWYYPNQPQGQGDTSITQYAMLGLWSAARAGVDIPLGVWDRAAAWHVKTQLQSGGFAYHPSGGGDGSPKRTMTAAAVGSLQIARLYLYPDRSLAAAKQKKKRQPRKFKFLEPIDLDNPDSPDKPREKKPQPAGNPTTPLAAIDNATKRGIEWLAADWAIDNNGVNVHYYLYALERMTALADVHLIGDHDWYAEASAYLLQTQQSDGGWSSSYGKSVDTPFGLLCLGKATAKMLNREERSVGVGAGLLAGGRGLPDNLAQVQVAGGEVKARKLQGPLDELLAELENPRSTKVDSVQAAVLEKVQLGDREELIGQTERLARLARDKRAEVRRTALWALGRSGDVRYAPVLIAALDDTDLDVLVEARNALCTLSRKPRGFGLPNHPYAGLAEDAAPQERSRALDQWRADAAARWRQWYLAVRPYDERDGLPQGARK